MSKQDMQLARELIKRKDYTRARAVLAQVDHPTAREWERKLDAIAPPKVAKSNTNRFRNILIVLTVISVLGFAAFYFAVLKPENDQFAAWSDFHSFCFDVYGDLDMYSWMDGCSHWATGQAGLSSRIDILHECQDRAGVLTSELINCMARENILPPGVVRN